MASPVGAEPEVVAELRVNVRDWLAKAAKAVESFYDASGHTFWRDSSKYHEMIDSETAGGRFSATTTARCYMSLAYADRCLRAGGDDARPAWVDWFSEFIGSPETFKAREDGAIFARGEKSELNNFDIAHLADFHFVATYVNRFFPDRKLALPTPPVALLAERLLGGFAEDRSPEPICVNGQIAFESVDEHWVGHHFFVTLHSLRALSILGWELELRDRTEGPSDFSDVIRQFCIEQCFYVERGVRHRQDIVGLAFAATIYCLYAQHVNEDLCIAVIDSLAAAQQENGSWPTAQPVFRGGQRPWHITSHDLALCLTWLYFQPRVPDAARPTLLTMMERYFRKWVIKTYMQIPKSPRSAERFSGWLDDHTTSSDFSVGWATAIVCHFLSNYNYVLDNHLNRRVIESIGLQSSSSDYVIDINAHARSKRWSRYARGVPRSSPAGESASEQDERDAVIKRSATWFDLAPFAWREKPSPADIAARIRWHWTDPSGESTQHSLRLAERVLLPIFQSPGERPSRSLCAGMLCGAPGTRKTSLVQAVGGIIEWPVVTVPASVIFERGFDLMEARASEVFRRLSYLTGCVIFFDEFEEFFRDRGEDPSQESASGDGPAPIHDRTIAAFTTPAMLPRLQDLHDVGRCLIFFATNHPEKVDRAIKRPGRFDFRLEISHPNRERVLAYLDHPTGRTYEELGIETDNETLRPLGNGEDEFTRISKPVKDAIASTLKSDADEIRFAFVEAALKRVAADLAGGASDADGLKKSAEASLEESRKLHEESETEPPDL